MFVNVQHTYDTLVARIKAFIAAARNKLDQAEAQAQSLPQPEQGIALARIAEARARLDAIEALLEPPLRAPVPDPGINPPPVTIQPAPNIP